MEVTNPGSPLVDSKHFINATPQSRNKTLASLFRRLGICEELGRGWDKIVSEIEMRHLPAPRIQVHEDDTRVILYAARPLSEMNSRDRIRAIYLHACFQYAGGKGITNTTVRKRFGMNRSNIAKVSRMLTEALTAGEIVPVDPDSSRKFMQYYPYWVHADESL